MDLTGKKVVITGASRGIGAETARLFALNGAKVGLVARSRDAIETLQAEIGEAAIALPCDMAVQTDIETAIAKFEEEFGAVDVLINNAAVIAPIGKLSETDSDEWVELIDINVKGVYLATRLVLPKMIESGGGTILNISSGAAHNAIEAWSAYCTSKAAVAMFTACIHNEEAHNGIRALGLSPGTVATQMQREIKASGINAVSRLDWSDHIPASWPARALLWMCSPDADEFCGSEISLRNEAIRRRVGLGD